MTFYSRVCWGFPGGKVEPGEELEDAVVREVYEETGFHVATDGLISERVHPDFPVRVFYFACRNVADVPDAVRDHGTQEFRWVAIAEVASYFTSELDMRVRAVLDGLIAGREC